MRRRSNTLYADTVEEYTFKALNISNQSYGPTIPMKRSNSKKKLNASLLLPLLLTEDKPQAVKDSLKIEFESPESTLSNHEDKKSNYWSDFDFKERESPEICCSSIDSKFSLDLEKHEENSCVTVSTEDTLCSSPESALKTVTRKFMVIGLSGSGRHSLVNSIFDSKGKEGQSSIRQTMDLIIKTRKEEDCETKYQFWMRALNTNRFDGLIKVYYRNASVFLFVYSVANRESFEALNEAIEAVLKEVPREKFVGILLGNKSDLEKQRKVNFAEGKLLKEKYNLSIFLETHKEDRKSKEKVFSFLHNGA